LAGNYLKRSYEEVY